MSASFRNPRKSAGLKTTVLPCSLVCFLPDDWILPYAPVEPAEDDPPRDRRWQKQLELSQRARLAADLMDRIRGVCDWSLKHWDRGEAPLWELMAQLDRLFPGIQPIADPAEVQTAQDLLTQPHGRNARSGRRRSTDGLS